MRDRVFRPIVTTLASSAADPDTTFHFVHPEYPTVRTRNITGVGADITIFYIPSDVVLVRSSQELI
jgi:hypothetical protein